MEDVSENVCCEIEQFLQLFFPACPAVVVFLGFGLFI